MFSCSCHVRVNQLFLTFSMQGSKALGSNFVFHWPSATFSMHSRDYLQTAISQSGEDESVQEKIRQKLDKTTSALHAAANEWTDGVILPQHARKVCSKVS